MRLPAALIVALSALLAMVPGASAVLPASYGCEAVAPETTECSTGSHLVLLAPAFTLSPGADYTGTILATLTSDLGEMGEACSYEAGASTGCLSFGSGFLLPGAVAVHACASFDGVGTVRGGSGAFGCSVSGVA